MTNPFLTLTCTIGLPVSTVIDGAITNSTVDGMSALSATSLPLVTPSVIAWDPLTP